MSIAQQFQKASPVKEHALSADVESLISHTRLDTPEYRSRLRSVTPGRQLKQAYADLAEARRIENFSVDDIVVPTGRRPVRDEAIERLVASMRSIGLRTPISVRYYDQRPPHIPGPHGDAIVLMTGAHRLEAAKRLGWDKVECFVYTDGNDVDAQLWEIAENLHRAELTAMERDEQIALWVTLNAGRVSSQVETKPQGGRPESGVNAAARELGISKPDAHRAVTVARLSDEAKAVARETGLDDNRTALLEAAKHSSPADQAAALAARKAELQSKRAENDALREQHRAALPDAIKEIEARKQQAIAARSGTASAEHDADRIAELEESVRVLEAEAETLRAENKLYGEMRVQFEQGGFDKVIAGKDNEIRALETRVYSESADKAAWIRASRYWKDQALKLGYVRNPTIDIDPVEVANG